MNSALGSTSAFSNVESIPMLNGSNFWEWKEHLLLVLALMDLDISLREDRPDVLGFTSSFSNVESIPMLKGSNFWEWKEHLLLVLALMDLDISLREDHSGASFKHTEKTELWDRSNRVSMMIMRIRIPQNLRGVVSEDVTTAKGYLAAVEKCYAKNEKSEMSMVVAELCTLRKEPNESAREYIMRNMGVAAKMKKLGMHIPDDVVASMFLDSLPSEYNPLKRTYSPVPRGMVDS